MTGSHVSAIGIIINSCIIMWQSQVENEHQRRGVIDIQTAITKDCK